MRVLFVEDDAINRRVVKEMLRARGVDMAEAEDGLIGLQMIDTQEFDLVLMDLRMPVMDGVTALRHTRARADRKAALPVIVVTADDGPTIDSDCISAGADDVIHKPVSMASLFGAIGTTLAHRGKGGGEAAMLG
jgi:CheY-like chemotaxis protein